MALWGNADSKTVAGTVAVTQYDAAANAGAGNASDAKTVIGDGTFFLPKVVTAGSFTEGVTYTILTLGTTDFSLCGSATGFKVGETFVATGAGTGTGTATQANTGLRTGQTLNIVGVPYKVGSIVSDTEALLTQPCLLYTSPSPRD